MMWVDNIENGGVAEVVYKDKLSWTRKWNYVSSSASVEEDGRSAGINFTILRNPNMLLVRFIAPLLMLVVV